MELKKSNKTVLILDAGGTNFVFSAIKAGEQIVEEIRIDSNADNLDRCMSTLLEGFRAVSDKLKEKPSAISFAFPGPADYPNGIIGDLPNLPAFKGGVALGPMLEDKFNVPVFINNDGDLFAYGEALAGILPEINTRLKEAGSPKRYKNLLGVTLGTGFGGGIVSNNQLLLGDNSIASEIWLMRDKLNPFLNIEDHTSIRSVKRIYAQRVGIPFEEAPAPKDIYEMGIGKKEGKQEEAIKTFELLGEAVGDALSNAVTLVDGLIVIGGGLSGAYPLFMPKLINEMNGNFVKRDGSTFKRLVADVYNLEEEKELNKFLKGAVKEITVYGTDKKIKYDPEIRIGVGISKIGTSKAISLGAYAFALNKLK